MTQDSLEITDTEVINAEKAIAQKNPLYILVSEYLTIKTKKGELVPFKLNTVQRKVLDVVWRLIKTGKPIRIWVLKFRQGGISTFIEGLIYAMTSQKPNRNSLIMGDEGDKSEYLFQMSKLFHEELEKSRPYLVPKLKKSNAKALEFEEIRSQIIIDSAENPDAARAFTYLYVHLSEVAFFKYFTAIMGALNQSVPDHADTMIIGETTANGKNEFYDEWLRAVQGKTAWFPLFLGWYLMDEYRMPLENGELYPLEGIKFDSDTSETDFLRDEDNLRREFGCDEEQLNWRRWAIVNKCQGSLDTFRTEYPATWQEAFAMSGAMFFDRRGIEAQRPVRPLAIGNIFYQDGKWEFRSIPDGIIEIYEHPSTNEQYIIAGDASEGVDKDEAAVLVLNKRLNTTAAIVAANLTPEDLADTLVAIGNYYNRGLIVPENKGYGYQVCQIVYKSYGNIYRKEITKDGGVTKTLELGFNTNSVTRPQYLAQMNDEIKNRSTELKAKKLIDECMTFIIKRDKEGRVTKVESQTGFQDGLVICRAIAGIVRNMHPYKYNAASRASAVSSAQRRAVEESAREMFAF